MPTVVFSEESVVQTTPVVQEETTNVVTTNVAPANLDEDKTIVETQAVDKTYKQPISKRKIAKKFLLAMFGVGISSFLIFFVLTLYNKIRGRIVNQVKTPEGETTLQSPDDYDSAVRIFLDKTKWK